MKTLKTNLLNLLYKEDLNIFQLKEGHYTLITNTRKIILINNTWG